MKIVQIYLLFDTACPTLRLCKFLSIRFLNGSTLSSLISANPECDKSLRPLSFLVDEVRYWSRLYRIPSPNSSRLVCVKFTLCLGEFMAIFSSRLASCHDCWAWKESSSVFVEFWMPIHICNISLTKYDVENW